MPEKFKEKIKELEEAILVLQNIKEAGQIERFKFTPKETSVLDYTIKFIQLNLEEFKE